MKGLVLKSTGNNYKVKTDDSTIFDCRIKGKLRLNGIRSTNPIAVGDYVFFDLENESAGIITDIDHLEEALAGTAGTIVTK